jgi:hypothetical protein
MAYLGILPLYLYVILDFEISFLQLKTTLSRQKHLLHLKFSPIVGPPPERHHISNFSSEPASPISSSIFIYATQSPISLINLPYIKTAPFLINPPHITRDPSFTSKSLSLTLMPLLYLEICLKNSTFLFKHNICQGTLKPHFSSTYVSPCAIQLHYLEMRLLYLKSLLYYEKCSHYVLT